MRIEENYASYVIGRSKPEEKIVRYKFPNGYFVTVYEKDTGYEIRISRKVTQNVTTNVLWKEFLNAKGLKKELAKIFSIPKVEYFRNRCYVVAAEEYVRSRRNNGGFSRTYYDVNGARFFIDLYYKDTERARIETFAENPNGIKVSIRGVRKYEIKDVIKLIEERLD